MRKIYIKMDKITDIQRFCTMAQNVAGGVVVSKGKYASDGSSILGVIAINPPTGMNVEYEQTEDTFAFDTFVDAFMA